MRQILTWAETAELRLRQYQAVIGPLICADDTFVDIGGGGKNRTLDCWRLTPGIIVDHDPERLDDARAKGLNAVVGEIGSLPFADESLTWGLCSHTMEHVDDLDAGLRDIFRVIRCGCLFVIPLEDDVLVRKSPGHIHHNPDPEWWVERIEAAGFTTRWYRDAINGGLDACYLSFRPDAFAEWESKVVLEA